MISPGRMVPRGTALWLGAWFLFAALWSACGEEAPVPLNASDVLARVGDEDITVEDYRGYLIRLPAEAQAEVQTSRLLQAIIDEKLIVAECRRLGLDKSSEYRDLVQQQTRRLSLAELYRRQGIDRGVPSTAQLEDLFAASPYHKRVRFSLLMVKDPDGLPPLIAQLQAGADFEELSMAHSQDPRILMRHADMGYHRWGETMPSHETLTRTAFTMETGQLAGPLAVADGHFLLKVTDIHPVSLAQERETIVQLWHQQHLARQMATYCDTLMARFTVRFEEAGLAALWSTLETGIDATPQGLRQQIVVRLSEGQLTVEACQRLLIAAGDLPKTEQDLRRRLHQQICREVLMLQEIGRLDLVNSVEVKAGLVEVRRKALLDLIRRRIENEVPAPSLNLVRLHYESNREDYREPGQVVIRRRSIPDRNAGQHIIDQIAAGIDTAEIFDRFVQVTYPTQSGGSEFDQALQGPPGSIHGPIEEDTGHVVLQILQQRQSRIPDFTEVQERVTRDLLAQERSEVFGRFLQQLRAENANAIEIHGERLERLGHV